MSKDDEQPKSAPRPERRIAWLAGAALVALVLIVFGRVIAFDFVRWDDDINITQNPLLKAPWSRELLAEVFGGGQTARFEPLHWLIDRLLFEACGLDPRAWHALNLALHVAAAGLFFHVLRRMLAWAAPTAPVGKRDAFAWIGAALWALHPLRAEPVAWATASTYSLTTVCLLASFACYLQACDAARHRVTWWSLSWLFAVASYASYPVGLSYGVFLFLFEAWRRRAHVDRDAPRFAEEKWKPWLRCALFVVPAMAAVLPTLWSRFMHPGIFSSAPTVDDVGIAVRLTMALASVGYLGARLIWTTDLTPNMAPLALDGPALWPMLLLAGATLVWLGWAGWKRQQSPGFAFVTLGFAALSMPCLGLTEVPRWPLDRYAYLAQLPLVAGLVIFAMRVVGGKFGAWLALAFGILVMLFGLQATRQTRIWANSATLFAAMESHPQFHDDERQAALVYVRWAQYETDVGRTARGRELFERAHAIYLAGMRAAVATSRYDEALELSGEFAQHFRLGPNLRRERGAWLIQLSRYEDARRELLLARAETPDDPRIATLLNVLNEQSPPSK